VWWRFTAPAIGRVTIDTSGSSFDTLLGVHRGTTLSSLVTVAGDDDSGDGSASRTTFDVAGGQTYYIAVDGYSGAEGSIVLAHSFVSLAAPSNDNFVSASTISITAQAALTGTNVNATKEPGEPLHAGSIGGRSVWWRFTAPSGGLLRMDTNNSTFDTVLAVYTGSSVDTLTTRASDDDDGFGTASYLEVNLSAGQVYHVAVDGYGASSGSIRLAWNFTPTPTPSVTISIGSPTSGGLCSDNFGCYFVNANLSNFPAGSRVVRCYGRTNTGWQNYATYSAANGATGGQCAYSYAGRAVRVVVDGTMTGGPNTPILESGTWSNIIDPWPTN
jgi:hypothetical protein